MGRFARNVVIAVGLLVVGTAHLFFALTFLPDPLFREDLLPGDLMPVSPAFDYCWFLAALLGLAAITILPVVVGAAIVFRKRNPRRAHLLLSISVCFLLYTSLFLEAISLGADTYLISRARAGGMRISIGGGRGIPPRAHFPQGNHMCVTHTTFPHNYRDPFTPLMEGRSPIGQAPEPPPRDRPVS